MKRIHDEREIRSTRGFGHVKSHYAAIRSFAAAPAAAYDTLLQKGAPAFFLQGASIRGPRGGPFVQRFCRTRFSRASSKDGWNKAVSRRDAGGMGLSG